MLRIAFFRLQVALVPSLLALACGSGGSSEQVVGPVGTGGASEAGSGADSPAGAAAEDNGGAGGGAGEAAAGGAPGETGGAGGEVALPAGPLDEPCDRGTYIGGFSVDIADGFSRISGRVDDGPALAPPLVVDEADGCQLLENVAYDCDAEAMECRSTPEAADAGTVSITGLGSDGTDSVSMTPGGSGYYQAVVPAPPHPAFIPGAVLTLSATGAVVPAFSLATRGVDDLEFLLTDVPVSADAPVELSWTPPSSEQGTIEIRLDVGHHGGSPAEIVCNVDDDGEFAIPTELVAQLFEYGVWGYPAVEITRHAVGSVSVGEGCVELVAAAAPVNLTVSIEGVVSCNDAEECEAGQSCEGLRCL